jgi:hypothetical protein
MPTGDNKSRSRILLAVAAGLIGLSVAGCEQRSGIDNIDAKAYGEPEAIAAVFATNKEHALATGETTADSNTLNRDVTLLIRVKFALVRAPGLKALPIDVGVLRGAITLYGEVDTPEQRDMAERITRSVPGVRAVESEIAVIRGS